jgi:hypothetical protein
MEISRRKEETERAHKLCVESPAAVAGDIALGSIRQQPEAYEGGNNEDDKGRGEKKAFFGTEGQVKVSELGGPVPSIAVAALYECHRERRRQKFSSSSWNFIWSILNHYLMGPDVNPIEACRTRRDGLLARMTDDLDDRATFVRR